VSCDGGFKRFAKLRRIARRNTLTAAHNRCPLQMARLNHQIRKNYLIWVSVHGFRVLRLQATTALEDGAAGAPIKAGGQAWLF
jgi:hypothetical protein